jgi:hypothetical protein
VRDGEDIDQVPGLKDENAEEDMGLEIYKRDHIDSGDQPRAQSGPIKEKHAEDSSKLTQNTINYQNEEDKVPEDHVMHWQKQRIFDLSAIVLEWQKQQRMRQ